jgi:hypothetical protein
MKRVYNYVQLNFDLKNQYKILLTKRKSYFLIQFKFLHKNLVIYILIFAKLQIVKRQLYMILN